MSDSPEIRIGTDEREQAMAALSGHFSAGRLSLAEFEDRSGLVAQARTRGDLESVFSDLPADRAPASLASPRAPSSPRRSGWEWRAAVVAVMPFVALALFFLTNTWLWFLMIPASGAILYAGGRRHQDTPGELPDHKPEAA